MINKLTPDDLHLLLSAKLKEPGLSVDEIYTSLSKIHAKPRKLFCTLAIISLILVLILLFIKSLPFFGLLFILFIISLVWLISIQSRYEICSLPSVVIVGLGFISVFIVLKCSSISFSSELQMLVEELLSHM
jgi:hypothetical protein